MNLNSLKGKGTLGTVALLVGCAACCALPIVGVLGLGGAVATTLGWLSNNAFAVVGGLVAFLAAGMFIARSVVKRHAAGEQ